MADSDDVCLEFLCKGLIGESLGVLDDMLEEREDLLVVLPVKVETQLLQTLSPFILLVVTLTSRPPMHIFFKTPLNVPTQRLQVHAWTVETVGMQESH